MIIIMIISLPAISLLVRRAVSRSGLHARKLMGLKTGDGGPWAQHLMSHKGVLSPPSEPLWKYFNLCELSANTHKHESGKINGER